MRRAYRVIGRVQGVGFRFWTVQKARGLGVSGTVRNAADGSVVVEAAGDPDALDRLEEQLRRGPPLAIVQDVVVLPATESRLPEGFEVAH